MDQSTFPSSRRDFVKSQAMVAGSLLVGGLSRGADSTPGRRSWKIAIHMDTSVPTLGLHGLHAAFWGLPDVEIVAIYDANSENIEQRLAGSRAKRHYTSYVEMLEKERPDIVVLTTRLPNLHLGQIREAAKRGCHIYCEKPLCAFLEEADEIVQLAETHRIQIAMAHPCRHGLGFVTMKRLIAEGRIGKPLTVQGWGKSDHRGGGEDMMTLGTHIFDLMIHLFGAPETVTGDVRVEGSPFAGPPLNKTTEDIGPAAGDEIFATFRFAGGVRGIFESRKGLYDSKTNRMGVSVIGSQGMLSCRFSDMDAEPQPLRFQNSPCAPADASVSEEIALVEERVIPDAEDLVYNVPGMPRGPIFAEAGRFAAWDLMAAIEEGRPPVANIQDARTALEMIHGVYASHLANRTLTLPLEDRRHPLREFQEGI